MNRIQTVRLELLRPGPVHNQLLSPLTAYIAICGNRGVVTLNLPFEHRQLLWRLATLRYVEGHDGRPRWVQEPRRQAEVEQVGQDLAEVLARVPPLLSEMSNAAPGAEGMVHLRLILWGSELGLVPWEFAYCPKGFGGERQPMLLQGGVPVTLTREVRGACERPLKWNRKPKVLFCHASPEGGGTVPARSHLLALRAAIDPWLEYEKSSAPDSAASKLPGLEAKTEQRLGICANASVDDIRRKCAEGAYTHVHILAHGVREEKAGVERFGLALHAGHGSPRREVVTGSRLATALMPHQLNPADVNPPLMVTLAVCDSGNVGEVMAPGASIAHDLHDAGIPWVVASQLPLTTTGSATFVDRWYGGVLQGHDPRRVLSRVRQDLHTLGDQDHDWGSLVAYAAMPPDFEDQVFQFRQKFLLQARNACFKRALALVEMDVDQEKYEKEIDEQIQRARSRLDEWKKVVPVLEEKKRWADLAEYYGMVGSTRKKEAEVEWRRTNKPDSKTIDLLLRDARKAYQKARRLQPANHWVLTQTLAMQALLGEKPDSVLLREARALADDDRAHGDDEGRVWALGTLAELELLDVLGEKGQDRKGGDEQQDEKLAEGKKKIGEHLDKLVENVGYQDFKATSTRDQFLRYRDWWSRRENMLDRERASKLAAFAVDKLVDPDKSGSRSEKPQAP